MGSAIASWLRCAVVPRSQPPVPPARMRSGAGAEACVQCRMQNGAAPRRGLGKAADGR